MNIYEKYLKQYKTKSQKDIKNDIFNIAKEIIDDNDDSLHFIYFAPLIMCFADGTASDEELEIVNEINNKFKLGHERVCSDIGNEKMDDLVNGNLREFLVYVLQYRDNQFDLSFIMKTYDKMVQYMIACLSLKKSVSEEELNFIGQIGEVELGNKGLSYDLRNPQEEDNGTAEERSDECGLLYVVLSKFNVHDDFGGSWVTIDIEGISNNLGDANQIAKNTFEKDRNNATEIWDDDCDYVIEEALKNNSPISLAWVHIEFDETERRDYFLDVVPIEYNKKINNAYLCLVGIVNGESPVFGDSFDRRLKSIYYSKKEAVDALKNYTFEDGYIDKNEEELVIELQDELMSPYALIKFIKLLN